MIFPSAIFILNYFLLQLAFSSTTLFEPFAIPLLLEKLSSSLPLAKVGEIEYSSILLLIYLFLLL